MYRLWLAISGSDYHNDGKKGVGNPRYLGMAGTRLEEFEILF